MFDYISADTKQIGLANHLKFNCGLAFVDETTRRGNYVSVAKYKNIVFEIFKATNTVKITGSLHRLFNDGLNNYNDFTRLDLYDTIHGFCDNFGIDSKQLIIHAFEWGVNFRTPFDPSDLISRVVACRVGKVQRVIETEKAKDFLTITFTDYTLKLYYKGLKYGKGYIIRFEVHVNRMSNVGAIPELKTLNDLYKIPVLEKLGKRLVAEFKDIIIAEPMATDLMKPKELETYQEMTCKSYWQGISKHKRSRAKKYFDLLIAKYGNGLKAKTILLISQKWNELLEVEEIEASTIISKNVTFSGVVSMPIGEANITKQLPFTPYSIVVKGNINETNPLEKIEVFKICSNCKKVLKIGVIKYCDLECELQRLARNKRSNPNHKAKLHLQKLTKQPTLFKQFDYMKIDPLKMDWLHQQGFNLQNL